LSFREGNLATGEQISVAHKDIDGDSSKKIGFHAALMYEKRMGNLAALWCADPNYPITNLLNYKSPLTAGIPGPPAAGRR
jgi:hypothetical protein